MITAKVQFNETAEARMLLTLLDVFAGDAQRRKHDLHGALASYEEARGICTALAKSAPVGHGRRRVGVPARNRIGPKPPNSIGPA